MAADLLFRKGEMLFNLKEYEKAVAAFQDLFRRYPTSSAARSAFFWIGQSYERLGRDAEALQAYRRQAREFPQNDLSAEAEFRIGEIHFKREAFAEAAGQYQDVLQRYAASRIAPEAGVRLGEAWLRLGDLAGARRAFNKVLTGYPKAAAAARARLGLGKVALEQKEFAQARQAFGQVLQMVSDKTAAEAQYLMGESYWKEGRYKDAALEYLKVKYLYGNETDWVVRAVFRAAECNERLSLLAEARKLYLSVINDFKNKELAAKAQERLRSLSGK